MFTAEVGNPSRCVPAADLMFTRGTIGGERSSGASSGRVSRAPSGDHVSHAPHIDGLLHRDRTLCTTLRGEMKATHQLTKTRIRGFAPKSTSDHVQCGAREHPCRRSERSRDLVHARGDALVNGGEAVKQVGAYRS